MTQREKLIKLIKNAKKNTKGANCDLERDMLFADYLLENGVIVPPCKMGDTVWLITVEKENNDWYILEDVVDRFVRYDRIQFVFDMKRFGYLHVDRESNNLIDSLYDGCICSTKEEAEKALAERRAENG